jgi:hypothetical protein
MKYDFNCFSNHATKHKKPLLLFESFTDLTVHKFNDIYDKEIAKRYERYGIQRLSKRKDRERKFGAGRPFKLDI